MRTSKGKLEVCLRRRTNSPSATASSLDGREESLCETRGEKKEEPSSKTKEKDKEYTRPVKKKGVGRCPRCFTASCTTSKKDFVASPMSGKEYPVGERKRREREWGLGRIVGERGQHRLRPR